MNLFDIIYNRDLTIPQEPSNVEGLWISFINLWATRMENRHRIYFRRRIGELLSPWQNVLAANPSPQRRTIAEEAIERIYFIDDLYGEIRFEKRNLT